MIINADVLQGPGARDGCAFFDGALPGALSPADQEDAAAAFLQAVHVSAPLAILSPGWTTAGEGLSYSASHVDAMVRVCHRVCGDPPASVCGEPPASGASQPDAPSTAASNPLPAAVFTFPVRGSYVRTSWPQLSRLLASLPPASAAASGLTVWSNVPLPAEELAWLAATLDPQRTLYDIKGYP